MKISSLYSFEVLDSRGKPTVRTVVELEDGSKHSSSVPSGASTGTHEAVELRDGDNDRYLGFGVSKAVENVNSQIQKAVKGLSVLDPNKVDSVMLELDGTNNKSRLGANAILSVSQAVIRAAAHAENVPIWKFINQHYFSARNPSFPRLMVNVVNGGKHAGWNFDIQEFMIVPTSHKPSESIRIAAEIFAQLGKKLKKQSLSTLVGDEGGYSPLLKSNEEVFDTITGSATDLGYANGAEYQFAIDAAASEFYENGTYVMKKTGERLNGDRLLAYYRELQQKYNIISFEDPFAEDDWDHFKDLTPQKDEYLVVGDDLYVTNPERIQKGIKQNSTNAVLIKLNQIGSVSETMSAIALTQNAGWKAIISHRSGETEDPFIADVAYGVGADFIKTGSMSRSERLAKYNRLIEIENGV